MTIYWNTLSRLLHVAWRFWDRQGGRYWGIGGGYFNIVALSIFQCPIKGENPTVLSLPIPWRVSIGLGGLPANVASLRTGFFWFMMLKWRYPSDSTPHSQWRTLRMQSYNGCILSSHLFWKSVLSQFHNVAISKRLQRAMVMRISRTRHGPLQNIARHIKTYQGLS